MTNFHKMRHSAYDLPENFLPISKTFWEAPSRLPPLFPPLAEGYLVGALKILQNRAARCVTKLGWYTSSRQLLKQCNWLSIKQLIFYQTVLQVHRVVKSGSPLYLSDRLVTDHLYNTRQAAGGCVRWLGENSGELSMLQGSFLGRASKMYNEIPVKIRNRASLPTFKKELKT